MSLGTGALCALVQRRRGIYVESMDEFITDLKIDVNYNIFRPILGHVVPSYQFDFDLVGRLLLE